MKAILDKGEAYAFGRCFVLLFQPHSLLDKRPPSLGHSAMTTLVNGLSQPFAALQALLQAEEAGG